MSLKTRVERLELTAKDQQKIYEIELGDGRVERLTSAQIRHVLSELNGADTGPGPARSRRGTAVEQ